MTDTSTRKIDCQEGAPGAIILKKCETNHGGLLKNKNQKSNSLILLLVVKLDVSKNATFPKVLPDKFVVSSQKPAHRSGPESPVRIGVWGKKIGNLL